MGTILTSYGDPAYEHEGFADRRMPTGEYSNGEWSTRYPANAHVAFVATCACGWRGTTEHPPTDAGEELALAEWEHTHARPVLGAAQAAELDRLQAPLRDLAAGDLDASPRSPRELAEHLAHLATALETAAARAWRLSHQASEQAVEQAGP